MKTTSVYETAFPLPDQKPGMFWVLTDQGTLINLAMVEWISIHSHPDGGNAESKMHGMKRVRCGFGEGHENLFTGTPEECQKFMAALVTKLNAMVL